MPVNDWEEDIHYPPSKPDFINVMLLVIALGTFINTALLIYFLVH